MWNKSVGKIGLGLLIITIMVISLILLLVDELYNFEPGDLFALGQLIVEVLLLPIVLVGFYIAVTEFRATQQLPKLDLYWEPQTDQFEKLIELVMPPGTGGVQTPRLVLRNAGFAVTSWYLVRIDIPRYLYLGHEPRINRLVGNQINAIGDDPHWHLESQPDRLGIIFMSNGKFASYPGYPQPLYAINLHFSGDEKYPSECKIPYMIYTDQGQQKEYRELFIKLLK